jgi:hypothetical protein
MSLVNEEESSQLPAVITQNLANALEGAFREMSQSMTRVQAEKDLQKDIAERMHKEFQVPKKDFNRMAKMYHAANLAMEAAKDEEFYEFARSVFSMIKAPGIGYDGGEE